MAEERLEDHEQRLRQLMIQARCLVCEVRMTPPSGWPTERKTGTQWHYSPLDYEAAQNLLPLDLPPGSPYFLHHMASQRHPDDANRINHNFRETVARKAKMYSQEYRCLNKHHEYQWISETVHLRYEENGDITLACILQDITAMREAEQSLQSVIAQTRCLVWSGEVTAGEGISDPEQYQWSVHPLNEVVAQEILPLDADESTGYAQRWFQSIHPEDRKARVEMARGLASRQSLHIQQEFRCRDREGRLHWMSEDSTLIPSGDRHWRLVGVCIDITTRKEAEEAILQASNRLRQLMTDARCLIFEGEITAPADWRTTNDMSQFAWAFKPIDGDILRMMLPIDTPQGQAVSYLDVSDRRHPDDQAAMDRRFFSALQSGAKSYSQEYRLRDREGQYRWVSETVYLEQTGPVTFRAVGTVVDINSRIQAELDLRSVMSQAQCIIWYGEIVPYDDPSDFSRYKWNVQVADAGAAQRIMPLEVPEGRDYFEVWCQARVPEDHRKADETFWECMKRGGDRYANEFRCCDRDGSVVWMSETVHVRRIAEHTYRLVGVCVNITSQKLAEAALQEAKSAAEQANAAKSAFLANMSHEIRTPMTAILGYTDLLQESTLEARQKELYITTIRRNGEHLLAIINDILDLSKIEAGERLACDPWQLVNEVVAVLSPRAQDKQVIIEARREGRIPDRIVTDPTRLRQVMMNLVGNAIKFTEQGSVILAVSDPGEMAGRPRLRIEVRDTGIGIAPEQVEQLFRPFQQADLSTTRRFGGTGLGLAISRRIAQLLGGDITVASCPGSGSTFTVMIDAARPTTEQLPVSPARSTSDRGVLEGARILLAEDGPDNQRLICHHLRKALCETTTVENGRHALELATHAAADGHPFDVILMDMQMPIMDGYVATRELRAAGYEHPILALTAHAMEGDRQRCIDAGCNDYIVKPLNVPQFMATLAKYAVRQDSQAQDPCAA